MFAYDAIGMSIRFQYQFSNTGEHHGIFYSLNNTNKIDLLGKKFISLSSSPSDRGNIEAIVNYRSNAYRAKTDGNSIFVQITFLKGYIFPTGYTINAVSAYEGTFGMYSDYSKSWYVYGIYEGDESNTQKWEKLGENDTTQSTYCQNILHDQCFDPRIGSYSLKELKTSKGFKHLRWQTKEGTAFLTAGIDVYGAFSLSKLKNSLCRCRRQQNYFVFIDLVLNF